MGRFPQLMGIVNVTPDSFSDGGEHETTEAAVAHALKLVEEGADILDIGGESTRPDAEPVSVEEELRRVVPVIQELSSRTEIPISIDTTKAEVARESVAAGAVILNDISGLQFDPEMISFCASVDAGVICMHIQGTPQTMQESPHYNNVVEEVYSFFEQRLQLMQDAGIAQERIVFDPGIGFGKTARHNVELLRAVPRLRQTGCPLLIGHSRKRFLGKILKRKVDERLWGTVGISVAMAQQGADLLRVHDVAATRDALLAWRAVSGEEFPDCQD